MGKPPFLGTQPFTYMTRRKFRILIALGIIAIAGLVGTQIYWLYRALQIKNTQFDHNVEAALATVSQHISHHRASESNLLHPVKKIASFQYIVLTNDEIDPNLLSFHLRRELGSRGINRDFEYTLFDCNDKALVFSDYVKFTGKERDGGYIARTVAWPKRDMESYYFGVYFPDGDGLILNGLGIWTFSSIAILFVAGFFGYAIYELLRQRRLSEIQRDFIDAMTHEFKTPLTTISLVGEAISNPSMAGNPEKLTRYAGMIRREVGRLKDQVDTILTTAKDYERKPDLKLELLQVAPILEEMQAAFAERIQDAGMTMQVEAPASVRIMADRIHLANMLSTLIDNAVKYAGSGCMVTVRALEVGSSVRIEVDDTGPGMDTRTRRMAGNKFFRARRDADAPKGFGLGLFYVRNMMRNHKGRLEIASKKGEGATLSLVFPRS